MRVALVNLPHKRRVMRRYVASYYAPNFLIPPMELMSIGAILKRDGHSVTLIDSIAEPLSSAELLSRLEGFDPGLLITMLGFKIIESDLREISRIKERFPQLRIAVFGYLPTHFPEEILSKSEADIVIVGEPELSASELCSRDANPEGVKGLAFKSGNEITVNPSRPRIHNLDSLPFPDISLINPHLYNESFLGRPIATVLTARGCPFLCTYCVKQFGPELIMRSPENVVRELTEIVQKHRIRNIRFLDDTFTANLSRAKRICQLILDHKLKIRWTCLTRPDTIDTELLALMKASGCKRIYAGVESGSQRILNFYRKGYTVEKVEEEIHNIRKAGIEVSAFFIVGSPIETDEDISLSIELARRLHLDYIIVTMLQFWPGTPLFENSRSEIEWNLLPFKCYFKDPERRAKPIEWERRFYREFYLRPSYIFRRFLTLFKTPSDVLRGYRKLKSFLRDTSAESDDFI